MYILLNIDIYCGTTIWTNCVEWSIYTSWTHTAQGRYIAQSYAMLHERDFTSITDKNTLRTRKAHIVYLLKTNPKNERLQTRAESSSPASGLSVKPHNSHNNPLWLITLALISYSAGVEERGAQRSKKSTRSCSTEQIQPAYLRLSPEKSALLSLMNSDDDVTVLLV